MPSPVVVSQPDVRSAASDDDQSLREYVRVLWRFRLIIAAVTLTGGVLACISSVTAPRRYEADVALAVSPSKLANPSELRAGGTANFRPLIESRSLAARVINEFGLDKPPHGLSPMNFFGTAAIVEEVRNSTIISLTTRLRDPDLSAKVANRVAELAVEMSRRVSQQEAARSRDDIKKQLDESKQSLDTAETSLGTFRSGSQLEVLRKDVDAQLNLRGELLALLVKIEEEKGRVAKAEQELAKRPRIDTLRRSIDSEPALMESARKPNGQPGDVLGLQMRQEVINPVYDKLDEEIATGRTEVAALERRRAQMVDVRKLGARQLQVLTDLYQREAEFSRLEMERDLRRKVYLEVATSYETARLLVGGRSSEFHVIDEAIPPDAPMPRYVVRNTLIGLLLGLLCSMPVVLISAALSANLRRTSRQTYA